MCSRQPLLCWRVTSWSAAGGSNTTIDAISKIELILDDIKEQAITIITKAAEQANVRLNGKTVTREHDAIRDSLSHNIGKIAATAVMNFINRKVTIVF
ncbi:hypothetical protein RAS_02630 [Rickettsia asiatica]|uniref:Uncharacterized protein n=1 Tax=Rickettsia asiatica TaxID=238800 RepID=A0A510G966_9RICK|nr:hypothetical protein [Rickettsia asiatica]BBJ31154.1 hypothetical protein RAS_02630 [Rickettsia asiatica]